MTSELPVPERLGQWLLPRPASTAGGRSGVGATIFVVRAPFLAARRRSSSRFRSTRGRRTTPGAARACTTTTARAAGPTAFRSSGRSRPAYLQPLEWELHLVRFLEREGYDVAYQTDVDTHRDPASLLRHRLVIVAGHGEYWSSRMRDAFEQARDAGDEPRVLRCERRLLADSLREPGAHDRRLQVGVGPGALTRRCERSQFRELDRPECQLLGVMFQSGLTSGSAPSLDYVARAPADDPWFVGTGLAPGTVVPGVVGPEWDTLPAAPPDGCVKPSLKVLFDYTGPPIGADSVRYVADSGARVFSSGSMRFAWGLDAFTPPTQGRPTSPLPALQQFVRNMLADLLRPAPPASVSATVAGTGTLRVRVARTVDPRVVAIVVRRDNEIVCRTTGGDCLDRGLRGHRRLHLHRDRGGSLGRVDTGDLRALPPSEQRS